MKYNELIELKNEMIQETDLLSIEDFKKFYQDYLDNNSDLLNYILQQANTLDLFLLQ